MSRHLVVETTGRRVFVDLGPEDLGMDGHGTGRSVPTEGPIAPPDVTTTPEHFPRLTGG